jgi:hypothetical protein
MRIREVTLVVLLLFSAAAGAAGAKDKPKKQPEAEAKELSGISIVGNKEAPKSLFIVPWKSSELGVETSLSSRLLNEKLQAVDKDVFERELDFYSVTTKEK